jgi:hypothetical protein
VPADVSQSQMTSPGPTAQSAMRRPLVDRLLRGAWVLALAYHTAAVIVMTIPSESVLFRRLYGPFSWYVTVTGVSQNWNMFDSIPNDHEFSAEATVRLGDGDPIATSPVPPFLTPLDTGYFRYHTFFRRISGETYQRYRDPYLENLRQAVARRTGLPASDVSVRVTYHRIRLLENIRADGQVSTPVEEVLGPLP